jgi:hypothetical protein
MGVRIEQNKVEEKVLEGQMNGAVEKMAHDKCCLLVSSMSPSSEGLDFSRQPYYYYYSATTTSSLEFLILITTDP